MEQTTQRWLAILVVIVAIYLVLLLGHTLLGIKITPW